MQYQVIKHLKTKKKLIKLCDSLQEAINTINANGGRFNHLSYVGGFPVFRDDHNHLFSIQGLVSNIVCSINKKELELARFCG